MHNVLLKRRSSMWILSEGAKKMRRENKDADARGVGGMTRQLLFLKQEVHGIRIISHKVLFGAGIQTTVIDHVFTIDKHRWHAL